MLPTFPVLFLSLSGLGIQVCRYRCDSDSRCKSILYDDQQFTCGMFNASLTDLEKRIFPSNKSAKSGSFHKRFPLSVLNMIKTKQLVCVEDGTRDTAMIKDSNALTSKRTHLQQISSMGYRTTVSRSVCSGKVVSSHSNLYRKNGCNLHYFNFSTSKWRRLVSIRPCRPIDKLIVDSTNQMIIYNQGPRIFSSCFNGKNKKLLTRVKTEHECSLYLNTMSHELVYVTQFRKGVLFWIISVEKQKDKGKMFHKKAGYTIVPRCIAGDPIDKILYIVLEHIITIKVRLFSISYISLKNSNSKQLFECKSSLKYLVFIPSHQLMWYDVRKSRIVIHSLQNMQHVSFVHKAKDLACLSYLRKKILICEPKKNLLRISYLEKDHKRKHVSKVKYDALYIVVG